MMDERKLRERLTDLRELVRAGRERLRTHSPVWAVYLSGETLRSMAEILDEMQEEIGTAPSAEARPIRKIG